MIFKVSSSIIADVSSLQFLTGLPSKYLFPGDSNPIMSNLSVIPYIVTILLAVSVAFSISFEAPVDMLLNLTSSAALPRSEERRVGKSVDLGGRRIIKKKKKKIM